MRFLFVSNISPWRRDLGIGLRASAAVESLASLGTLDVCLIGTDTAPESRPGSIERCLTIPAPAPALGRLPDLLWFATSSVPRSIYRLDPSDLHREFRAGFADRYDLVWVLQAGPEFMIRDLHLGPTVFDLPDLEDRKARSRLESTAGLERRWARRVAVRKVERSWRRHYRDLSGRLERLVVCSELDRDRLGLPNVSVVPNTYPVPPDASPPDRAPGAPLRIGFVGQMDYLPNSHGATWLVERVLPLVRRLEPDAEVIIMGGRERSVASLRQHDGVHVTGYVDDIHAAVRSVDIMAVPIWFGGGTRLKAVEALAHRVPVVGTSMGLEGLGLEDGVTAMIADDPAAFAAAIVQLGQHPDRRRQLADAGHQWYLEHLSPAAATTAIAAVVDSIVR